MHMNFFFHYKWTGVDTNHENRWSWMYMLIVESAILMKFSSFLLLEHKKGDQTYQIIEVE